MDLQLANTALALDKDVLQNRLWLQRVEERKAPLTMFCRDWLLRREYFGQYELLEKLRMEDAAAFKNFLRVDPLLFQELVDKLTPRIMEKDTWFQKALPPGLKVAITLRYLATDDSYHSLMYSVRVAHNIISYMVKEVCEALVAEYSEDVLNIPTAPDEWQSAAELFNARCQFPHDVGTLGWKHVAIRKTKDGNRSNSTTRGTTPSSLWLWSTQTISSSGSTLAPLVPVHMRICGMTVTSNTTSTPMHRLTTTGPFIKR